LLALGDVGGGLLDGGLDEAARAPAGLQPPGGEPRHLQREAAPDAGLAADDLRLGAEPAIERQAERMHPAVARRAVRLGDQRAPRGLARLEFVAGKPRL